MPYLTPVIETHLRYILELEDCFCDIITVIQSFAGASG